MPLPDPRGEGALYPCGGRVQRQPACPVPVAACRGAGQSDGRGEERGGVYTELARASLRTGEEIAVGVVEPCGDSDWQPRVEAMLGHKSAINRLHVEAAFRGPLDDLQTLFYVGVVQGELVTISMLAGAHGAAIYGHVVTRPAWRRRGAASALHRVLAADWRRRGYRVVTLSTDAGGHAQRLYAGVGFRPLRPGAGDMIWHDEPGGEAVCLADGPTRVGPMRWGDWGWLSEALCAEVEPEEELPRSVLFRVRDLHYVDWPFIAAMTGADVERSGRVEGRVLRQGKRVLGWAALLPHAASALGASALELYLRPGARADGAADALLAALPWSGAPVIHACTPPAGYRAAALARHGFLRQRAWPRWWDLGRRTEAAVVWVRPGDG